MKYDVVIVGAGLGGLTSGAMLAKKGKKVLVLEQHAIPGGCATVFTRKGIRCEVGLHEMDFGKHNRDMKHLIFKKLGLDKTLPLVKLPQLWSIKTEENTYTIPEGQKAAENELIRLFPHEMKGIKRYFGKLFRLAYSVRRLPLDLSFLDFFFYPLTSLPSVVWAYLRQENVGTVMDKMIQDNRLKHILNANIGYFHDDPYTFCWYFHAAAQASYYNASVYIKGGSQVLSNQLVDIIKANGGDVICNAMVEKITVEKSTATGVLYKKKGASEVLEQKASAIIANCAPQNVFKEMLPPEYAEPWAEKLECAPSLCTVYIIFKKKFISLYPHNSYSTFIQTEKTMDKPISTLFEQHKNQPIEERVFIFVDYSTIDSGLVNKDDERSFAVLTVVSYLNEWEHLSKDEYTAKKEDLARKLFQRVEKLYPGFIENIEYYEVSTPKTIQRYIGTPGGSAYGFKQNRFLQKSRAPRKAKKVKNLYFASAWNFPGGGFTGVIVTGYMAAIGILRPVIPLVIARLIVCVAASFAVMQGIGLLLRILK